MRHTSINLQEDLERVTKENNIEKKHVHTCADNAANIQGALSAMDADHDGCAAHKINLVAKDSIKNCPELKALEQKMNGTIHFTRKSNEGKKFFFQCQEIAEYEGMKYCDLYF